MTTSHVQINNLFLHPQIPPSICAYLNVQSIAACLRVSRIWRETFGADAVWQSLFTRDFLQASSSHQAREHWQTLPTHDTDFKRLYQQLYSKQKDKEDILALGKLSSSLESATTLQVENVYLSETQVKADIEQFFSNQGSPKTSLSFLKKLQQTPLLFEIAHITGLLQRFYSMWEEGNDRFATHITDCYHRIIRHRLRQGQGQFKNGIGESALLVLGKVAEETLKTYQQFIPLEAFEKACEELSLKKADIEVYLPPEIIKKIDGGYIFLHSSFQDYCAAYYATTLSNEELKTYVIEHRKEGSFQLLLPFLAGLLHHNKNPHLSLFFEALYLTNSENQSPEFDRLELSLRCLNECPGYTGCSELNDNFIQQKVDLKDRLNRKDDTIYHLTQALQYLYRLKLFLPEEKNSQGVPYFLLVCLSGNIEMVQWLYSQNNSFIKQVTDNGYTAQHAAAVNGDVKLAQWLHSQNPSLLTKKMSDGLTPLHLACLKNHLEMVQWICNQNSEQLMAKNEQGKTPFHIAQLHRNSRIAEWIQTYYPWACKDEANEKCIMS